MTFSPCRYCYFLYGIVLVLGGSVLSEVIHQPQAQVGSEDEVAKFWACVQVEHSRGLVEEPKSKVSI